MIILINGLQWSGYKKFALAKNGLRYPIPPYGIQSDVRAGMGVSYGKK